jgi:hypothetical protein
MLLHASCHHCSNSMLNASATPASRLQAHYTIPLGQDDGHPLPKAQIANVNWHVLGKIVELQTHDKVLSYRPSHAPLQKVGARLLHLTPTNG